MEGLRINEKKNFVVLKQSEKKSHNLFTSAF